MREVLRRLWAARRIILLYIVVLSIGWVLGDWLRNFAVPEMRPMNEPLIHRIVTFAFIAFVITAAIPFVPGAEIGLALLFMFGGKAAPMVYLGMVGALILSFSVARYLPRAALGRWLSRLGLKRTAKLMVDLGNADPAERPDVLKAYFPSPTASRLLRNRYLLLALAINVPGNSIIGGGGGIAFVSGLSGAYAFWPFVLTIAIAVAPVPLFFLLAGSA